MRQIIIFFTILCSLSSNAISNPKLDPYSEVGITEVYLVSPSEWYIELDGNWCLYNFERQQSPSTFPCSSDVYLRIKSGPNYDATFLTRVGFAANKIGVISQTSVKMTAQQRAQFRYADLRQSDTVMITLDTSRQTSLSTPTGKVQYWSFPLRPVPETNSLIAVRDNRYKTTIYSTIRKSIGRPNNNSTKYKVSILDKYGIPLKDIRATKGLSDQITYTDTSGTCYVPISLVEPETVVNFCDIKAIHHDDEIQISSLTINYSDADTLVKKELRIPVTQYMLNVNTPDSASSIRCLKEREPKLYSQANLNVYGVTNAFYFRIYPSLPACALCFTTSSPYNTACLGTWSGSYIDTPAIIHKTIAIDPTATSHKNDYLAINSGITFTPLSGNRQEIRVIISSSCPSVKASISLCAFNGREIATLPVTMNRSGTTTSLLRIPKEKLSSGKYLCTLTMDGYSPVKRQITIP